jgi:hypothetical protein
VAVALSVVLSLLVHRSHVRSCSPARGHQQAYHVPPVGLRGGGLASPPMGHRLRLVRSEHQHLPTHHCGPSVSSTLRWLILYDVERRCTCVDPPTPSELLTTVVLVVTTAIHSAVAVLSDVATLSQGLRTPPLQVTHALGGYCPQKGR